MKTSIDNIFINFKENNKFKEGQTSVTDKKCLEW